MHAPAPTQGSPVTHRASITTWVFSVGAVSEALVLNTHWDHKQAPHQTWRCSSHCFCSFPSYPSKMVSRKSSHLHFAEKEATRLIPTAPVRCRESEKCQSNTATAHVHYLTQVISPISSWWITIYEQVGDSQQQRIERITDHIEFTPVFSTVKDLSLLFKIHVVIIYHLMSSAPRSTSLGKVWRREKKREGADSLPERITDCSLHRLIKQPSQDSSTFSSLFFHSTLSILFPADDTLSEILQDPSQTGGSLSTSSTERERQREPHQGFWHKATPHSPQRFLTVCN